MKSTFIREDFLAEMDKFMSKHVNTPSRKILPSVKFSNSVYTSFILYITYIQNNK